MKRNISNKIYEIALFATSLLCIFNIIGLWITWKIDNNPVGYVAGTLMICGLAACSALAFFNEKVIVRKQWWIWLGCFVIHIVFFILAITLSNGDTDAVPALFTVVLVLMLLALLWFLLKDRLFKKHKPYTFTPTVADPGSDTQSQSEGDVVQPTIQIKVEKEQDNTPMADFKPVVEQPVEQPKEEKEDETPFEGGGVITL